MTYSYDPSQIRARGKDQMRFEIGDTQTDGGADSCALSDEEYESMLAGLKEGKRAWLFAKLSVLEAVLFRMQFQVNTKIDVLQYDFGERAARWQAMYETLKKEALAAASVPSAAPSMEREPSYFHKGMGENPGALRGMAGSLFHSMTT